MIDYYEKNSFGIYANKFHIKCLENFTKFHLEEPHIMG